MDSTPTSSCIGVSGRLLEYSTPNDGGYVCSYYNVLVIHLALVIKKIEDPHDYDVV